LEKRILAFSSSRVGNGSYLESAAPEIKQFLGDAKLNIAFVPFASVNPDYEVYANMVRKGLSALPHQIRALNNANAIEVIENADVIMVGGSNIAGATICTSNDMPIINPGSFIALEFLPFQINPHYYNQPIVGFNGETRDQRLAEFLQLNPSVSIVALPEGTALKMDEGHLHLIGNNALLLRWENQQPVKKELSSAADLSFLLQ